MSFEQNSSTLATPGRASLRGGAMEGLMPGMVQPAAAPIAALPASTASTNAIILQIPPIFEVGRGALQRGRRQEADDGNKTRYFFGPDEIEIMLQEASARACRCATGRWRAPEEQRADLPPQPNRAWSWRGQVLVACKTSGSRLVPCWARKQPCRRAAAEAKPGKGGLQAPIRQKRASGPAIVSRAAYADACAAKPAQGQGNSGKAREVQRAHAALLRMVGSPSSPPPRFCGPRGVFR